ncbi:MAG: cytidylate kinase-like family protein [Rhodospirillaceae bacterium]
MSTVHSAIQALLAAASIPAHEAEKRPAKPVIAISRDHGALGRQIATALAKRLDVPVYDREILNKIAERLNTDPQTLKMLDECVARARDMWMVRLFTGIDLSEDAYRNHLINVIFSLARSGGIILGRGANVVLSTSCALRVRVIASPEVCTSRVMARYGISEAAAREQIEAINHNRSRFVWEMFQHRGSDLTTFDLVVNTDRFDITDEVVETLHSAYNGIVKAREHKTAV